MLRRDMYLMRGSAEVGEEVDHVSVGRIEEALSSTGVGAQEAEALGRMCCGRPKSVNRVVMAD